MRVIGSTIATMFLAGTTMQASAAAGDGEFAVYGWGTQDCKSVYASLEGEQADQARELLAEWISGYITGRNRIEDGIYDLTPINTHYPLVSLAQSICANNTDQLFESVINAMIEAFSTLRLSENSPTISLSHKEQSVNVNEAIIPALQKFLISEGHLPDGTADGVFGPKTAEALENWQSEAGLTPSGLPEMITLFAMAQRIER